MNQARDLAADKFVTDKISFNGLEHIIGGPLHNENVESFKAGWDYRSEYLCVNARFEFVLYHTDGDYVRKNEAEQIIGALKERSRELENK